MDNTDLCVTQIAKYAAVCNTRYIYTIYLLDTRYIYTIYHTLDIYLRYSTMFMTSHQPGP